MRIEERISELAAPILAGHDAFLIEVAVRGERGSPVAEVFVDADNGVTSGLCEVISRELSLALDAGSLFRGRYYLVVSSPGIERPLKFPRQYPRNVGRSMSVKVRHEGSVEQLRGTLLEAAADEIVLETSGEDRRRIRFEDIAEARVEPAW
jgi:ribosome maturation factor RimP